MADKKKSWFARHKVLTIILALVLIGIIGAAAGGGDKSTNTSNQESNRASEMKTAKIGEAARDGKFEFIVNGIECGRPNVGSDFLTKSAQGQYCLLRVNVKNIGNEKQSLFSSNQKLLDASNREYSADDQATLYASPQGSTASWFNDINPGNSVDGVIVFDVPKDVVPITTQMHDSAFSGGVKVNLQ